MPLVQWLRTDGRSVEVTTATQPVWLTGLRALPVYSPHQRRKSNGHIKDFEDHQYCRSISLSFRISNSAFSMHKEIMIVASTDSSMSFRNRCLIERFVSSLCYFDYELSVFLLFSLIMDEKWNKTGIDHFYAPGLKGPPGASSVWIVRLSVRPSVCPSVCLSVCPSVRNSVPLTNKVQYLKFWWSYSNQTWTVSSSMGPSHFTDIPCPWGWGGVKM